MALFLNYKVAIPFRIAFKEMGYPQPKIPTVTDNLSVEGLVKKI